MNKVLTNSCQGMDISGDSGTGLPYRPQMLFEGRGFPKYLILFDRK